MTATVKYNACIGGIYEAKNRKTVLIVISPFLLLTTRMCSAGAFKIHTDTHTHTRLTAIFPGLPGSAGTRKVKPIWILLKQETLSGSGISWAICKCATCSRQTTTPEPHHSVLLHAGCPSCRPTSSVKALKTNVAFTIVLHTRLTALCPGYPGEPVPER